MQRQLTTAVVDAVAVRSVCLCPAQESSLQSPVVSREVDSTQGAIAKEADEACIAGELPHEQMLATFRDS